MEVKLIFATKSSYGYDPWGRRRKANHPTVYSGIAPRFDRGYTMHEHYDGFTLINMKFTISESSAKLSLSNAERCELGEANGRLYAPVIGRMLQPDIVIQDAHNAQAYNSYSYCLNNKPVTHKHLYPTP